MSVIYKRGNIFNTEMPAIGHGVNTHGVMGAGIAKDVRQRHPDVYEEYKDYCRAGKLRPGQVLALYSIEEPNRWIFNIASQDAPGPDARYEWIELGILNALKLANSYGLSGIALPRIGSKIGGLKWELVEPIIVAAAEAFPKLTVEIWEFDPNA